MRTVIVSTLVAAAALAPATAIAQLPARPLELRLPSGMMIGTGGQRGQVKDAQVTAAQLGWRVRPRVAITGTFGWARSRDLVTSGTPKLDVFTYDLGVETRTAERFSDRRVAVSAFAGLGAGARSYNYRSLDVDATSNLAGYLSAGTEVGMGRVAMRIEARDYVTGFKPLAGAGRSATHNDVVVTAAFRFNRRRAAAQQQ